MLNLLLFQKHCKKEKLKSLIKKEVSPNCIKKRFNPNLVEISHIFQPIENLYNNRWKTVYLVVNVTQKTKAQNLFN